MGGGVVVGADGSFNYDLAAGFWGPDSFSYSVEGPGGAPAVGRVTVYVAPAVLRRGEALRARGRVGRWAVRIRVRRAGDLNGDDLGDLILRGRPPNPAFTIGGRRYAVFGKADPYPANAVQSIAHPP